VIILIGLLIGFVAAIPIGSLNVFAISQVLKHNFLRGLLSGLTASFLDIIYCFWLAIASTVTAHQWMTYVGLYPVVFALSCGSGSVTWYLILAKYVSKYHQQFKPKTFRKILIGSPIILIVFVLYSLATLFF